MRGLKPAIAAGAVFLLGVWAFPLGAQTPTPKPEDARKIQKKLQKNKKSLSQIERKLAEEKLKQAGPA